MTAYWLSSRVSVAINSPLSNSAGLIGYAYLALQTTDDVINLRLFPDQRESAANHIEGVAALYNILFTDKLKQLKKNLTLNGELKLLAAKIGNPKLLEQSLLQRVKRDLFSMPWRSQSEFENHANIVDSVILQSGQHLLSSIEPVLQAFNDALSLLHKLALKNSGNNPHLAFLKDTQAELQRLVSPNFPERYSSNRMKELPRYLKALARRAERGTLNLASALNKIENIAVYSHRLEEFKNDISPAMSEEKKQLIDDFLWMIEEYKVSLFAQELKTPYPVSPKKLDQLIKEIEAF